MGNLLQTNIYNICQKSQNMIKLIVLLAVLLTFLLEVTNSKPLEHIVMKKRSVFDVIPGFEMKKMKDRQIGKIGHKCKCSDGSKHCILDERFYCRKTLTVLSENEDLQNLERQFRNERRRRRRHLKRLIKSWIKDEISTL